MSQLADPCNMGLPAKYTDWRPHQDEAVLQLIHTQRPFNTQIAPTGFGKSLVYMATALFSSNRAAVLTSTKGLQTQLMRDFKEIGLVDMRGRNAYPCHAESDGSRCDHGPCIAGYECPLKENGCAYFDAFRRAKRSPLVSTNYAYWMSSYKYAEGLGNFDLLICDEAHNLPNLVSDFLTMTLDRTNTFIDSILPSAVYEMNIEDWADWAERKYEIVEQEVNYLKGKANRDEGGRDIRKLLAKTVALQRKMDMMKDMEDNWIVDISSETISFSPVWPKQYTEKVLFFRIPKVVLTSATVCAKTAEMVGIAEEENNITEFPHSFPIDSRRLIHIPTVRMNHKTTEAGLQKWITKIDQILKQRLDRKGIIHTVSYDRRNLVLTKSKYKNHMITHNPTDTIRKVARFKEADPPAFLVSPSVTTGYDFPYTDCEFQIIGKVAWPDTRNKITKARIDEDKEYGAYVAMMELVQAVGRGTRAIDDSCENLVIDDNIDWFLKNYGKFAPRWFLDACTTKAIIPKPPPKLKKSS